MKQNGPLTRTKSCTGHQRKDSDQVGLCGLKRLTRMKTSGRFLKDAVTRLQKCKMKINFQNGQTILL